MSTPCNQKCPNKYDDKEPRPVYKVFSNSYIEVPKGTKVTIYINVDPKDPQSDTYPVDVFLTEEITTAMLLGDTTATEIC